MTKSDPIAMTILVVGLIVGLLGAVLVFSDLSKQEKRFHLGAWLAAIGDAAMVAAMII